MIAAMRYTVLALAYLSALLVTPASAVAEDASACYSIGSPDARAYCLAKAHHEPSQCYSIQSNELRAMCLAEVRK